jgi:HK97 family phage portal protein
MRLLPFSIERRSKREEREYQLNAALTVLARGNLGSLAASGVAVTPDNALMFSAVFACCRVIAEDLAGLPLPIYRRLSPTGKERATEYPLYSLLHDAPNPEQTSYEWRETDGLHLCTWGNCFSEIERADGWPVALWPLPPNRVAVERDARTRELLYRVNTGPSALDWSTGGVTLRGDQVFHVPGLSFNGVTGLSPVGLAREAIGVGMAAQEFGARFFANDLSTGAYVKVPHGLSDEAFKRLTKEYKQNHQGLSRSHRITFLEEGMDVERIGIPPGDAQFLETRKFTVREIARFYRMQPHKIQDLDNATFTNIEQQAIEHVVDTLRPWLVRLEQRINNRLIPPEDRGQYFAEFLVDGLLRGDSAARGAFYTQMFQIGAMSPNDIRDAENRNPIDGGNSYYVPLNMIPTDAPAPPPKSVPAQGASLRARQKAAGAEGRRRLRKAFYPLFAQAAGRIVKREEADVMATARKAWKARGHEDFQAFVDAYYGTGDAFGTHGDYVRKQMAPLVFSYMEAIQAAAADEVGAEPGMTPAMTTFATGYTDSLVGRWVGSSRGQISEVAAAALTAGLDPIAALQGRFDEWNEKRPDKLATWETKQEDNAAAVETFKAAGNEPVISAGGNACPICQDADGQPVSDVGYAPLHDGCECSVVPG